jgi:hypothetical protein
MSLFKSKVVQEGGLYSSATTLNEEQLFLVRFRQISPPIYQVKVYIGAEILYAFLASVGTIGFAHSFALARPLQSNNISTSDLGTTLDVTLRKFDVARIQERILNFVLLKSITESFAVLSTPQKSLGKVLPIDLIDISDIATISSSKKISLDAEILTDLIKFVEKRSFDAPEAESFLSKVFGKVLENTLNIQENRNIDFTKVLANLSIAAGIIQSISVEKVLANQSTIDFLRTIALTKPFSNQTEADFTQILNTNKSAKDDLEVTEDQIFDFSKVLANQSIVDFLRTIALTKPLEDTSEIETATTKTLTKSLADEAQTLEDTNIFDGSLFTLMKTLLNRAEIAEQISLLFYAIRVFDDIAETIDNVSLGFSTGFANDVDFSDENQFEIDISSTDFDILTDILDNDTLDFNKSRSDTTDILDNNIMDFNKSRSDTVDFSDDDTLDFNKSRSDTVDFSDDDTIDFNKPRSDTTDILDNDTLDFNKPRSDTTDILDNDTLDFNKPRSDTTDILDGNIIDFNKPRSDTTDTLDGNIIDFNKSRSDTVDFSDDDTIDFNKTLTDSGLIVDSPSLDFSDNYSDTFIISDSELVDIEISLEGFDDIINTSDSGSLISQGYALEDYFAENYAGSYREF